MRRLRAGIATLAVLCAAGGCRAKNDARATAPPAASAPAHVALPRLVATDGAIAVANLDAQIDSLEKRAADPAARRALVEMLLSRGQFLGRVADYERASAIAEALVGDGASAEAFETRASARATFHRFDDALADLAQAERRGRPVKRARAAIYAAMGRLDDAAALGERDEATMGPMDLASAGLLAGDLGDDAEAARLLARARAKYVDVSPFPLAWMDAREAALHERRGRRELARAHYARALALLPSYAHAAAHLAALSRPVDAIAILEPIASSSDDPDVLVQLADALRRAGRTGDARRRLDAAIARYDALVAAHPAAFADHAASMWLGVGHDPARALPLARANLDVRKTPEAYELFLTAALAAKAPACADARDALALPHGDDGLRALARTALAGCS